MSRHLDGMRFLCHSLSPFERGEMLRSRFASVDWEGVVALANSYFVVPALWSAYKSKGLTGDLPAPVAGYLEAVYRMNAERNAGLQQQLEEAVAALNGAGITPLLLKGGAVLATGAFPDPGARFMVDLDIRVSEGEMAAAHRALADAGYRTEEAEISFDHCQHDAPLWKDDGWARIELHRRLLTDHGLDTALMAGLDTREVLLANGAVARMMSPTLQVVHAILHSEISHHGHRRRYLDLRQLYSFVMLCHAYGGEVEWPTVEAFFERHGLAQVLAAYRHLAEQMLALPKRGKTRMGARLWLFTALLPFQTNTGTALKLLMLASRCAKTFSRSNIENHYRTGGWVHLQWNRLRYVVALMGKYRDGRRRRELLDFLGREHRGWSRSAE